ncbi:hypothetical protein [Sphingomonas qomolangmaensis]|uniref:Uncharacterized protein n=1 Tax=Sphingomonas qomolangmaensis TaxID=2918765 RepID=A0ABY5L8R2_9SPHN|nr:hypothetical protein [Sphingomonas qomolangmaensis]UUL83172.1 hypothetical protein NMP03_02750 [Sphingomonas qomolangmaensis]
MRRIVLAASLLFSTVMPFTTAHAAPAAVEAKQSLVEYLGSFESGGVTYDVYLVTDFGGGVY